jgi:hypothetical protein
LSSGKVKSGWKGLRLSVELAGLEAVIQTAKEAIEQMTLGGSMPITSGSTAVVVGSRSRRGAEGGEGPEVADCRQTPVLDATVQDQQALA